MPDVVSTERRSYIMSRIKSKDTKPEVLLRGKLHRRGLRFRKNYKALAGSPDIAFTRYRIAIFVDGDFWHGRNLEAKLERGAFSETRQYWVPKLRGNIDRDRRVNAQLESLGWKVMRFWETDIMKDPDTVATIIECKIRESMA